MPPVIKADQRVKRAKPRERVVSSRNTNTVEQNDDVMSDNGNDSDNNGDDFGGHGGGPGDGGPGGSGPGAGGDGDRGNNGEGNRRRGRSHDNSSEIGICQVTPNDTQPVFNLSSDSSRKLRDAVLLIPEFDGNRDNLDRYIAALENVLKIVGQECEPYLLIMAQTKLTGKIWKKVSKNKLNNIREYIKYLRTTFDPPKDIYQLQGQLGVCAQLNKETVDSYADRVQELIEKINEAHYHEKGYLDQGDKEIIDKMGLRCFKRGLKSEILMWMKPGTMTLREAIEEAKEVERDQEDRKRLRENAIAQHEPVKEIEKQPKKAGIKAIQEVREESNIAVVNNSPPVISSCQICGKKGHQATNCWSAPGASSPIKCQVCQKPGHTADKCKVSSGKIEDQALICQYCQKSGHSAVNCFKRTGAAGSTNTIMVCQICGKRGHTADKCFSIPCRNCGRKGHLTETCRNIQQSVQNQGNNNQNIQQNQVKPSQGQIQQVQCQLCNRWGHPASMCSSMKTGYVPNPIPNVAGSASYSQALAQPQNQGNQMVCNYCKNPGHYLSDCQIRLENNSRRAVQQGNANGRPAQGAQAEAIVNSQAHPTLMIDAYTDSE